MPPSPSPGRSSESRSPSGRLTDGLAALIGGASVPWRALEVTPTELLDACAEEDLTGLVYQAVCLRAEGSGWPEEVRRELARRACRDAAMELLRQKEILSVLAALGAEGIRPILLKGTALAYSVYDIPSSRPRADTDVLVVREHVDAARRVMIGLGYTEPASSGGELLFGQFPLWKNDDFGVKHTFDFHWKVSSQSMFANVLTYDELAADAVPVPSLGPRARAAGPVHALLLACVHPVMHHRNAELLIWMYDIHLLASRLSDADFDRLVDVAVAKQVAGVCAHELARARSRFGFRTPARAIEALAARRAEPSAMYLRPRRRWHDDLISSVRGLPRWRDRLRLLREVVLPSPGYILKSYGMPAHPSGAVFLLPALYAHRVIGGILKILAGRK